jgi:hypothetical protein
VGFREKWTGQKTKSKEIKPIDEEETYFKQMQTSFLNSLVWTNRGGTRTCSQDFGLLGNSTFNNSTQHSTTTANLKHHDVYPNVNNEPVPH